MLDDPKTYDIHDLGKDLVLAGQQYEQANYRPDIFCAEHDGREINGIVVAGMGGSALAALFVKSWLKPDLKIPFEIIDLELYRKRQFLV